MGAKPLRDRKLEEDLEALSEEPSVQSSHCRKEKARPPLRWISKPMEALVDLEDKEALYAILDRE